MPRNAQLPDLIAQSLRDRIFKEWSPGDLLPSEAQLAADYEVSRHTMRTSLSRLHASGLLSTKHGVGTFVTRHGTSIRAGLQELRSLHSVIEQQGHVAEVKFRTLERRGASDLDVDRLEIPRDAEVICWEREVLSDGATVAFDYSVIAAGVLPPNFDLDALRGSAFDAFAKHNRMPGHAVASVRAVLDPKIGWGEGTAPDGLYLLLDQVQFLPNGTPLSWSRIYFLNEGFDFILVRNRV
jgi:GntR family transcriptional regulator